MNIKTILTKLYSILETYIPQIPIPHLVFLYTIARLLSFLTYHLPLANSIIAVIVIVLFGYISLKKLSPAWIILVAELLLDGAGHFFEFQSLILRTWFLGIFGLVWFYHKVKERKLEIPLPRSIVYSMAAVGVVILWSVINGFLNHHNTINILQDAILYAFLLLLFPALEFQEATKKIFVLVGKVYILGSALFTAVTFFLYSSGIAHLRDPYYHWFRNVAAGKITDLGSGFFRTVLSEHLFIVPAILIITAYLIKHPKSKQLWGYLLLSLMVLNMNFSRIYFLALAVGLLVLAVKHSFTRWFTISAAVSVSMILVFCSLFFIASRGQTLGLQLFGVKFGGTVAPTTDVSGAIRLAILPDALRTIKAHPLIGSGLGATVTYIDPTTKESMTRTQFDWGYLEVMAELGGIGTIIFLSFLLIVLSYLCRIAYASKNKEDADIPLLRGLFAGAVSLFVMNLTTPSLFHGFGILYFVLLLLVLHEKQKSVQ